MGQDLLPGCYHQSGENNEGLNSPGIPNKFSPF
jgi:hypothetical protein